MDWMSLRLDLFSSWRSKRRPISVPRSRQHSMKILMFQMKSFSKFSKKESLSVKRKTRISLLRGTQGPRFKHSNWTSSASFQTRLSYWRLPMTNRPWDSRWTSWRETPAFPTNLSPRLWKIKLKNLNLTLKALRLILETSFSRSKRRIERKSKPT